LLHRYLKVGDRQRKDHGHVKRPLRRRRNHVEIVLELEVGHGNDKCDLREITRPRGLVLGGEELTVAAVRGRMYDRLPFDTPETIRQLGERLFTRIKAENEQALIRRFLAQGP